MNNAGTRVMACAKKALPVAMKTSLWFLKIMLPVSFGVMLLSYFNILPYISSFSVPLFTLLGLPGDAALVFFTSIFTNIYTAIAVISGMEFTLREGVIIAVMCLISHGFFVETIVMKKTGSTAVRMIVLRIVGSLVVAFFLNLLLPDIPGRLVKSGTEAVVFADVFVHWLKNSLVLSLQIIIVITILMILQRLMEEFGILTLLSKVFAPLMRIFGLPDSVSFLWIVGNAIGLSYGAAIMMDYADHGRLNKRDADLLNHHLALSHSQIEDTLLFAVIGLPLFWLIIPRLTLAVVAVWLRRLELVIKKKVGGL